MSLIAGSQIVTIFVIVLHTISFALMLLLLFEFWHIHTKRMELLAALGSTEIRSELFQRRILMILYLVSTIVIMVWSFSLYT